MNRPTTNDAERRLLADIRDAKPSAEVEMKCRLDHIDNHLRMAELLIANARKILTERL